MTPAGQSVGYVLGADGRLARTLSAGREPATATLGKSRITVGGTTRLTATVSIGAPGTVLRAHARPRARLGDAAERAVDGRRLGPPALGSLSAPR